MYFLNDCVVQGEQAEPAKICSNIFEELWVAIWKINSEEMCKRWLFAAFSLHSELRKKVNGQSLSSGDNRKKYRGLFVKERSQQW